MHTRRSSSRLAPVLVSTLALLGAACAAEASGPLRYGPKPNQPVAYEVEVTATLPTEIETYKGTIVYHVSSVDDVLDLRFEGGLMQSSRPKSSSSSHGRHDFPSLPSFPRGPMFFGPDSMFGGIGHAVNTLTLTPRGEIRTMDGNSQLPYLIGNLSLLVFEPLPEADQKSWSSNSNVAVTEKDDAFGWHRPRFFGTTREKITSGRETTSLTWQGDQGDLSTFHKTYQLEAPGVKEKTSANGQGRWTFNRAVGMPEALDYKATVVCEHENVTLTIPVTIKYHRLTDEQWAKLSEERKEKADQRAAERKAPIEGEEREKLLADLKSAQRHRQIRALAKLGRKDARDDEELAQAVKPLLDDDTPGMRHWAERALAKVSPVFGEKNDLNKDYASFMPLKATGPPVTADTPLPPGLIVAFKQHDQWYAGKVVGTLENDQVVIRHAHGSQTEVCSRSDLRLAPSEVDQPNVNRRSPSARAVPAGVSPDARSLRGYRVWTDDSGTFTIMAKFLGVDGKVVRLQRKQDGREVKVPMARLSDDDRRVVDQLGRSPVPDNPFE